MVWKEPVGVAVGITPWNYPMMMAMQKVAPGARGRMHLHPQAARADAAHLPRAPKILEEAGLPRGRVPRADGLRRDRRCAARRSPKVDKVGFTGSREVGKIIMRSGADTLKRVTLELGGKSPNIVFSDADLPSAIQGSANGVFWNQGEICSAGTSVFVERRSTTTQSTSSSTAPR